ncbi:hypothetical protein [Vibrio cincinnatiensis]|uniref:hypothetical protein n=1 Tax=Vibrio cincinnatiensis TaxID=675 RepID=UPI00389FDEA6
MAKIGDPDWCLSDTQKQRLIKDLSLTPQNSEDLFINTEYQMRNVQWPDEGRNKKPVDVEIFQRIEAATVKLSSLVNQLHHFDRRSLDSEINAQTIGCKSSSQLSEANEFTLEQVLDVVKAEAAFNEAYYRNSYKRKWDMVLRGLYDAFGTLVLCFPDGTPATNYRYGRSASSPFVGYCHLVLTGENDEELMSIDNICKSLERTDFYTPTTK